MYDFIFDSFKVDMITDCGSVSVSMLGSFPLHVTPPDSNHNLIFVMLLC